LSSKIKQPDTARGRHILAPQPAADTGREPPAFCFRHCVRRYSIECCSSEQKSALADTLWQLTQRSWNELIGAHRHGAGCEKIARDSIRVGIPQHVTDDVTLWAFRFHGKAPMVGYRDGRIFHIVWLDHDFSLYSHD